MEMDHSVQDVFFTCCSSKVKTKVLIGLRLLVPGDAALHFRFIKKL